MALPWIKLYVDLPTDDKSDVLADELGDPRAWTHVVELWLWAAKTHADGDLSGVRPATVARRSGYTGDPDRFVAAMKTAGFLTESDELHKWTDYQGAHAAKLERDRNRMRKRRAEKTGEGSRDGRGDGPATVAGERRGEERRGDQIHKSVSVPAAAPEPDPGSVDPAPLEDDPAFEPAAVVAGSLDDRPASAVSKDPRFRATLCVIADQCWKTGGSRRPGSASLKKAVRRMLVAEKMTPSEAARATAGLGLSKWARETGNTTWEHLARQSQKHLTAYEEHKAGRLGQSAGPGADEIEGARERAQSHEERLAAIEAEWDAETENIEPGPSGALSGGA